MSQAVKNRIEKLRLKIAVLRGQINRLNEEYCESQGIDNFFMEDFETAETLPLLKLEAKLEAKRNNLVKKVEHNWHPLYGYDYPKSIKRRRLWAATLNHKMLSMFATANDTNKWVLAVDGVFGFCESQREANRLFNLIGEIGESNFGCCQILPPHYIPMMDAQFAKSLGENSDMTKTKISDHVAIDIEAYINSHH